MRFHILICQRLYMYLSSLNDSIKIQRPVSIWDYTSCRKIRHIGLTIAKSDFKRITFFTNLPDSRTLDPIILTLIKNYPVTLNFDRSLGYTAVKKRIEFPIDTMILIGNLEASRLHENLRYDDLTDIGAEYRTLDPFILDPLSRAQHGRPWAANPRNLQNEL